MAVELIGGAFLSASIQVLLERLASSEVLDFTRGRDSLLKLLSEFKTPLMLANKVFNDAENKRLCDPNVKRWLDELEEAIYVAEDLLSQIKYEMYQRKLEQENRPGRSIMGWVLSSISVPSTSFDKKMEIKLRDVFGSIRSIVEQRYVLGLNDGFGNVSTPRIEPLRIEPMALDESFVFGRDSDKEFIVNLLVSEGKDENVKKISVIPIVGMGGVGKTTLAQLVFDENNVKDCFKEIRIWVTVSDEFDVFDVAKTVLEQITSKPSDISDRYQLQELQLKLKEAVGGKKFLLVLDDVWNEDYNKWETLCRPLESAASGSKIIVTTRNDSVASVVRTVPNYDVKTMSDLDSWTLFVQHAFPNKDSDARPDLVAVGKRIVEKCKGLPLAVKSLGGVLRSEVNLEEWEKILESELWELPERESSILPALWLSYSYLPPHLKRCFAYSSIFPKDYEFEKGTLISMWMAQDLLHNQRNKTVEETGEEYFRELISRSLFQKSSSAQQQFTMHDLVNDLATFVSGEFCSRLDSDSHAVGGKTRHLSYTPNNISNAKKLEVISESKHLRTFLALGNRFKGEDHMWSRSTLLELLQKLPCLRVLSLPGHSIENLPKSMGKLWFLKYLDLSWNDIKEIPNVVCTLYNLQTLLLSNCKNLTKLPNNMGGLIKLRHLDVSDTPLKAMPLHMGNMTDLQVLSNFVLGERSGSNIKELGKLQNLHGLLCISGLEFIGDMGDVSEATMMNKMCLDELVLKWEDHVDAADLCREREVLEKLRPHTNLKKLSIHSYKGTSFPSWLGSSSFSRMSLLHLNSCKHCFSLPPLGQLLSLKELVIIGLNEIVEVGEEFYSSGSCSMSPFGSLECLRFEDMSKWEKWELQGGNQSEFGALPRLKKLVLKNCPTLVQSVPNGIETLEIEECPALQFCSGQTFTSLECLKMKKSCHSMTSFALDLFPRLSELEMFDCPNLKTLSGVASSHLRKLKLRCSKLTGDLPTTIDSLSLLEYREFQFPKSQLEGDSSNSKFIKQSVQTVSREVHTVFSSRLDNEVQQHNTTEISQIERDLRSMLSTLFQELYKPNNLFYLVIPLRFFSLWFFNHCLGDTSICYIPPYVHNDENWVGLELYVSFKKRPVVRHSNLASNRTPSLLLADIYAHGISTIPILTYPLLIDDPFFGWHSVLYHVPRGWFPEDLSQCKGISTLFRPSDWDLEVEMCGTRLLYEQDSESLIQVVIDSAQGRDDALKLLQDQVQMYVNAETSKRDKVEQEVPHFGLFSSFERKKIKSLQKLLTNTDLEVEVIHFHKKACKEFDSLILHCEEDFSSNQELTHETFGEGISRNLTYSYNHLHVAAESLAAKGSDIVYWIKDVEDLIKKLWKRSVFITISLEGEVISVLKHFDPLSTFNFGFPHKEIPEWFNCQFSASIASIELPLNLCKDKNWKGLVICAAFSVDDDIESLHSETPFKIMCHLQIAGRCLNPVPVFSITKEKLKCFGHGLVWVTYIPSLLLSLPESSNESNAEARIHSDFSGLVINACGIRILYQEDVEGFEETILKCWTQFFKYLDAWYKLEEDGDSENLSDDVVEADDVDDGNDDDYKYF